MTVARLSEGRSAILPFVGSFLALLLLLLFPETVSEGVRSGLCVAYRSVLPAIIPFMVVTDLLLGLDLRWLDKTVGGPIARLFGVSRIGSRAILLGFFSGFPIGARISSQLLEGASISKNEARRLLYLSSIASPAFVVTGVGLGMLGDAMLGVRLYLVVLISHLLVGLPKTRGDHILPFSSAQGTDTDTKRASLTDAIDGAAICAIKIAAYISFFSVCSAIVCRLIKSKTLAVLVASILEIGSGAAYAVSLTPPLRYPLLCFCISFSGISVALQLKSFVKTAGIPMRGYLILKLLSGMLSSAVALFVFP